MSAQDRLQPTIKLLSPLKNGQITYEAKWIGDPSTKEKKLGIFEAPKIKGTVVQDLGVKGERLQLTFYFDDDNHDLTSKSFWEEVNMNGAWSVVHPVRGQIDNLYLSTVEWDNQPIINSTYTKFTTNWIIGLPDGSDVSTIELETNLDSNIFDAIDSAVDQFIANVTLSNFSEYNAVVSAVNKAVGSIKKNISKFENLQIVDPRLSAIYNGIQSTIDSFPIDTSALAAQFSSLFETLGLAQSNSESAVDNFASFQGEIDNIIIDNIGTRGRNAAAVFELCQSLSNCEIARAVTLKTSVNNNQATGTQISGIETRVQAITMATQIANSFVDMMERLDAVQVSFDDTVIEKQFVSQSGSYGDQLTANQLAIGYLMNAALNLKIEKVFTTKIKRNSLELAWDELGGPGEIIEEDYILIDKNYADFCRWNGLHGNDLIFVPAETELRIFV